MRRAEPMFVVIVAHMVPFVCLQNADLRIREDVVRGLYLEGVEEVYVASREVSECLLTRL